MQLPIIFYAIAAFAIVAVVRPVAVSFPGSLASTGMSLSIHPRLWHNDAKREAANVGIASAIVSKAELAHWFVTIDAELTFIGNKRNPRAQQAHFPVDHGSYCAKRVGPVCGGMCAVYTGSGNCLAAPGMNCLSATRDIGFCDEADCNGNCNGLAVRDAFR
ncbi:hypothetical protein BD414DRAFT_509989 [Trametes punicea]|nr:hypothetical protein BD414DRAFT_509989 [Trametes punicea]